MMQTAPERMNESGTCEPTRAESVQPASLSVLGVTYFVQAGNAIKIGSASNFKHRLTTLQTAHERPLIVLAVVPSNIVDEHQAHQKFEHLRTRGEWFRIASDLLYFIAVLKEHNLYVKPVPDEMAVLCRHLARLRPGHAAAHHITDLISMCGNYHRNPDVLRGNMQIVIQRILEART